MFSSDKHVTFEDIARYIDIDADNFTADDAVFFESFEEHTDCCEYCRKRLRLHFSYNLFLNDIGILPEKNESATEQIDMKALLFDTISSMKEAIGEVKSIIIDSFTIAPVKSQMRPLLGLRGSAVPIEIAGVAIGIAANMPNMSAPQVRIISQGKDYFEFDLNHQDKLLFRAEVKDAYNKNYTLVLRSRDGKKYEYPLKHKKDNPNELYITTDVMEAGHYIGAVVENGN